MRNWLKSLFPRPVCPLCGTPGEPGIPICGGCRHTVEEFRSRGILLLPGLMVLSVVPHQGHFRQAVLKLKYRGGTHLVPVMGYLMAEAFLRGPGGLQKPGAVTWVPGHRVRDGQRGYHPAGLLGREVASCLGLRPVNFLERSSGDIQAGLSGRRRAENVAGRFRIRKNMGPIPRSVLLVDDVVTSGATLQECARVLFRAGAEKIYCLTFSTGNPQVFHRQEPL